jgi:histidine triad (HIT) family protein
MQDCIFCKIVKHEVPATIVYEDADVVAFLDIMPARKGHLLIAPKTHSKDMLSVSPEALAKVMRVVQRCGRGVQKGLSADGFNVLQFNGRASGQIVDHLHFHVIPRAHNDGLRIDWEHEIYGPGEIKRFAEKIITACADEKT